MDETVTWQRRGQILINFIVPAMLFYLMEFYEHNPFQEVRGEAQLFNVLILEFIGWGLFFVCKKARISLRILTVLVMVFGLTNHYVMKFRSTPFVPWDVLSIGTAKSVAADYDFTPDRRMVIVTLIFIAIFVVLQFYHYSLELTILYRLIPCGAMLLMLGTLVGQLQDDDFQTRHYLYPFLFTPTYMTQVNGMTVTFAMDLEYIVIEKPAGYSASGAQELLTEYKSTDEDIISAEEYPNIIVIMDEAFSDLSVLSNFETNEDYMPYVKSILNGEVENTISGYLNVSVCGGNTANTEFEFLTGNTMRFLPMGSIPYQQYVNNETPSIASDLKELGYLTYGIHPYGATGWNRDQVYPLLGFENTMFIDDFNNRRYIRKYVSDASDFDQVIDIYKNKGNQPLFLFNVTMQNHGSYTDAFDNFTPEVKVTGVNNFALEQYLSLIQVTDRNIEQLVEYFSKQDEKTVLVFFGDHQPNNATVSAVNGAKEESDRYQVPYFIWANYDIEDATGVDTSANYLATNLLKAIHMPMSDYQNFLAKLEESYPVISSVRLDEVHESEDLMDSYKKLQYYMLFDWEGPK